MFESLINHAQAAAVTFGLLLALGVACKKVPAWIEEKAKSALEKLFLYGGPAEDKLLLAHLVYAETKFGPGTGPQKAAFVVDKILGLLPLQYRIFVTKGVREKAVQLFQDAFNRLELVVLAETKKQQENAGGTP